MPCLADIPSPKCHFPWTLPQDQKPKDYPDKPISEQPGWKKFYSSQGGGGGGNRGGRGGYRGKGGKRGRGGNGNAKRGNHGGPGFGKEVTQ